MIIRTEYLACPGYVAAVVGRSIQITDVIGVNVSAKAVVIFDMIVITVKPGYTNLLAVMQCSEVGISCSAVRCDFWDNLFRIDDLSDPGNVSRLNKGCRNAQSGIILICCIINYEGSLVEKKCMCKASSVDVVDLQVRFFTDRFRALLVPDIDPDMTGLPENRAVRNIGSSGHPFVIGKMHCQFLSCGLIELPAADTSHAHREADIAGTVDAAVSCLSPCG
ncbi:MAG: hypothetical protein IKS18_06645 [Lachnospiraceae bacterium]|nr:hypothetical protein [Lachnospiraceae bacterium]